MSQESSINSNRLRSKRRRNKVKVQIFVITSNWLGFRHAADAAKNSLKKIMLRTVDTDVVVIAVSTFQDVGLSKLWIAFGVGKHFRYIAAHEIASTLGQQESRALLTFHAFTGCDQTSSFKHIGKKTAWDAWSVYDEVTEVFRCLRSAALIEALTNAFPILEHYTVIMYDRTSTCTSVNTARKDLFTRKGREIDNIPPTADALLRRRRCFSLITVGKNVWKCHHNVLLLASEVG